MRNADLKLPTAPPKRQGLPDTWCLPLFQIPWLNAGGLLIGDRSYARITSEYPVDLHRPAAIRYRRCAGQPLCINSEHRSPGGRGDGVYTRLCPVSDLHAKPGELSDGDVCQRSSREWKRERVFSGPPAPGNPVAGRRRLRLRADREVASGERVRTG